MKTLLVAVDFSDAAQQVVSCAASLGAQLGARLFLLHVVEPVASYVPVGAAMDVIETAPPAVVEEDMEEQRKRLEKIAAPIFAAGVEFEAETVIGLAADEIVGKAEMLHAEHIILGSHGHGALFHLFSGSVVIGVLKRSPVPVIVVPVRKASSK